MYNEFESDWEFEYDGFNDYEGDMFFSRIPWRKIGGTLASALASGLASKGSKALTGFVDGALKNRGWLESELEWEDNVGLSAQEISDEMEYFAELAAEAESEAEADYFLGALASLAGPLISSFLGEAEYEGFGEYELYEDEADPFLPALLPAISAIAPVAMPLIGKGIRMLGNFLKEDEETKQAIKVIPKIVRSTAKVVAKQAKAGVPVTKKKVATIMAKQTKNALSSSKKVSLAKKQNKIAANRAKRRAKVTKKVAPLRRRRKARLVSIR